MTNLLKTSDYSIFKKHPNNVGIEEKNVVKIVNSIKAQNLLQFRPITVDGQMRIVDGQHRLEAAKRLGVEVFYMIDPTSNHETMALLNSNQRIWKQEQWMDYHISLGNEDLRKLKEYKQEKKVSTNEVVRCVSLTYGDTWTSIKTGKFKFPSDDTLKKLDDLIGKIEMTLKTIKTYVLSKEKFLVSKKFRAALISFLNIPDMDFTVFLEKIRLKAEAIRPCASSHAYYAMLRDIYNWRNNNPIG